MKRQNIDVAHSSPCSILELLQSHFSDSDADLESLIRQGSVWQGNGRIKNPMSLINTKASAPPVSVWFTAYPIIEFSLDPSLIHYQDNDLLIVWKPSAINTCQSVYSDTDCLTWGVQKYLLAQGSQHQLNTINRLDRDTHGLVIYGKNKDIEKALYKLFMDRQISKRYLLSCPPFSHQKKSYHIQDTFEYKGKVVDAETRFRLLKTENAKSWWLALPATGRTHQIRKHSLRYLQAIDGDVVYGGRNAPSLQLFCIGYRFIHPRSNQVLRITVWPNASQEKVIDTQLLQPYSDLHEMDG